MALTKEKKLGILIVVSVASVLVLLTLQLRQHTCEVCITFGGRTNCAIASGTTREEALRSATNTACAPISGGVTLSIQCGNTPPDTVKWLD